MTEQDENDGEDQSKDRDSLDSDEVYCTSCGETIKKNAEICPHCGVRQIDEDADPDADSAPASIPEGRVYELQKIARKSPGVAIVLALLLTPASYWYVGREGLAIVNFLTFNYLLLGFFIVPVHSYLIIKNARDELRRNGQGW